MNASSGMTDAPRSVAIELASALAIVLQLRQAMRPRPVSAVVSWPMAVRWLARATVNQDDVVVLAAR